MVVTRTKALALALLTLALVVIVDVLSLPTPSVLGYEGHYASENVREFGLVRSLAPGTGIAATFVGGVLQAWAGCHEIVGSYYVEDGRLRVRGELSTDIMRCPAEATWERQSQEWAQTTWLMNFLASGPVIMADSNGLLLDSGPAEIRIVRDPR